MIFFFLFLMVARTTSESSMPGVFLQWDVLLPFVIYVGQRRSLPEGLFLTLFASHLYSLSSSAPFGVFVAHYLVFFCFARLLSYVIYVNAWHAILLLFLALSALSRFSLTLLAAGFGHGWPVFSSGNFVWWGIFVNAFFSLFTYWTLSFLDRVTGKRPRINIDLGESTL